MASAMKLIEGFLWGIGFTLAVVVFKLVFHVSLC